MKVSKLIFVFIKSIVIMILFVENIYFFYLNLELNFNIKSALAHYVNHGKVLTMIKLIKIGEAELCESKWSIHKNYRNSLHNSGPQVFK